MSMSSPSNAINRSKANLTVASLMNCGNISKNTVFTSQQLTNNGTNKISDTTAISTVNTTSVNTSTGVPTVANSDLLYKNIVSIESSSTPPPLAPTSPIAATLTVNYTSKPYTSIVVQTLNNITETICSDSTISNIKLLTNSIINQKPTVQTAMNPTAAVKYSPTTSNLRHTLIQVAPVSTTQSTRYQVTDGKSEMTSAFTNKQISPGKYTGIAGSVTQNHTTKSKGIQNYCKNNSIGVLVPRGWNRIIEKEGITYVSPNKSRLRSMDDLVDYLQQEGTCKCGLECPFNPSEVFSFDVNVLSKGFLATDKPDEQMSCLVCKKFEELFPTPKPKTRGRKPGVKNKRSSSSDDTKPSPERKKILLTGASPLEMFQTKMDVINASSSHFAKKSEIKTKLSSDSAIQKSNTEKSPSRSLAQQVITSMHSDTLVTTQSSNVSSGQVFAVSKNESKPVETKVEISMSNDQGMGKVQSEVQSSELSEIIRQFTQNHGDISKQKLLQQFQSLLSSDVKSSQELNEISKALASLQKVQEPLNTNSDISDSAPPNRTITSGTPLPQALKSQLINSKISTTPSSVDSGIKSFNLPTTHRNTGSKMVSNPPKIIAAPQTSNSNISPQLVSQLTSLPQNSAHNTCSVNTSGGQQQMLLLQLVSKGNTKSKPNKSTISVSPKAYEQPQFVIVDQNKPNNVAIQALAVQSSIGNEIIHPSDGNKRKVQIKGLLPIQGQTQLSPQAFQYATAISPQFTSIRPSGYSVVQYITQAHPVSMPVVYPASMNKTTGQTTTNFVRIAPAVHSKSLANRISPLEKEKQKLEQELLLSMQEHLVEKRVSEKKVLDSLPKAVEFLTDVAKKIPTTTSNAPAEIITRTATTTASEVEYIQHSNPQNLQPATGEVGEKKKTSTNGSAHPVQLIQENDESFTTNDKVIMTAAEKSKDGLASQKTIKPINSLGPEKGQEYNTGDIVWVSLSEGVWPARLVSYHEVKQPKLADNHVYIKVMHTKCVHTVSFSQLRPFETPTEEEVAKLLTNENNRDQLEKAIAEASSELSQLK